MYKATILVSEYSTQDLNKPKAKSVVICLGQSCQWPYVLTYSTSELVLAWLSPLLLSLCHEHLLTALSMCI